MGELKAMHMVRHDGRLAMIGDEEETAAQLFARARARAWVCAYAVVVALSTTAQQEKAQAQARARAQALVFRLHVLYHLQAQGNVPTIIEGMRVYNDAGVQEGACAVLGNLAMNAANQKAIAEAGGFEQIVTAMVAHQTAGGVRKWVSWRMGNIPAQVGVQQAACCALGKLADNNAANQAKIARAGGIERVVAAMTAHPAEVRVMEIACWALFKFGDQNAKNQEDIVSRGGIERVVSKTAANPPAVGVQKWACGALVSLYLHPVESVHHVRRIKTVGGVECVQQAIVAADAERHTLVWGRQLLNNLDSRTTWEEWGVTFSFSTAVVYWEWAPMHALYLFCSTWILLNVVCYHLENRRRWKRLVFKNPLLRACTYMYICIFIANGLASMYMYT